MSVAVITILKSEWYKMSDKERIDALAKLAEEAKTTEEQARKNFTAPPPLKNTFPDWVKALIKELCEEFKTTRKYDDLNNEYKIALKDEQKEDFDTAWGVRMKKILEDDKEKAKWHGETPIQVSFYDHGGSEAALASDADLAELEQIQ